MMLGKKLKGLYVYTVSQVIYLGTVLMALSYYIDEIGDVTGEAFAIVVAMFFIAPSVLILALYWTNISKQHLR